MKAMKGLRMNNVLGSLKRKPAEGSENGNPEAQLDTPEANAARSVRLFCESGGPNGSGEEVLYLPTIVEAAESSPSAAKECAYVIRKFLSKDNYSKPYVQYNGIMLIRILADNPGKTFTRNIDSKFVQVVKELLRVGRDPSVKQILMETLDTFSREKSGDDGLVMLNEMWKKEHERMIKLHGQAGSAAPRAPNAPHFDPSQQQQNYFARSHHSRKLPNPHELSSRIEEARTSAKLLSQVVQSTPPSELLQNELVREFADRCLSASRSVQAYMIAEDPAPDNDTMETLIETNEQLSKAMSQHQRAVLNARKIMGLGSTDPTPSPRAESFAPPAGPPPSQVQAKPVTRKSVPVPPPGEYIPNTSDDDEPANPFADPVPNTKPAIGASNRRSQPFLEDSRPLATGQFNDTLGVEPYHPGFRETQSYVGRQESSVGKVTMHAAAPTDDQEEDSDVVISPQSGGPQGGSNTGEYEVQSSRQAPVYRY